MHGCGKLITSEAQGSSNPVPISVVLSYATGHAVGLGGHDDLLYTGRYKPIDTNITHTLAVVVTNET